MRIALASDFYAPFTGGVELQVQALALELSAAGHQVTVITVHHRGLPEREVSEGVEVLRLRGFLTGLPVGPGPRRYHPPFSDPLLVRRMRRALRERDVEIVQAHGWIAHSVARATRGSATRMVLSVRDYGYACAVRTLLRMGSTICDGPALGKCLRCAAHEYGVAKGAVAVAGVLGGRRELVRRSGTIHGVSNPVRDIVVRDVTRHAATPPVVVIPDLVLAEPATQEEAEEMDARLPRAPYILFVGALQPHKGIFTLLSAHDLLGDAPPLVLIGTRWPDSPARFPDNVTVLTDVPHSVVMAAWRGAMFGVVPSRWPDPLPGVVREAMISGRTVVASAVGGITDMVRHEENGLLVPPGDAQALAAAMHRLVVDEPLRRRLEEAARRDAASITAHRVVADFQALYERTTREGALAAVGELPMSVRRIVVIGGSGSGKTTFARALGERLSLEVTELDEIAPDSETRDSVVGELAGREAWIAEGIHTGWTRPLLERADVVIWLDGVGVGRAVARVFTRFLRGGLDETRQRSGASRYVRPRSYARHTADLIRAIGEIVHYHRGAPSAEGETRAGTAQVLGRYEGRVVRVRTDSEAEAVMRGLSTPRSSQDVGRSTTAP